jgi:CheB methylesterase
VIARSRKRNSQDRPACELIAMGASAGGLPALIKVVDRIDADFPAIVVGQHLDPSHKSQMAALLSKKHARWSKRPKMASHPGRSNLGQDAPISHVNLLVCGNVLIYFDSPAKTDLGPASLCLGAGRGLIPRGSRNHS